MKEKVNKNTEAAILEAAESLFKTNGFKGTTTTMIAGQAGVTHAMLHYYFRTKEQIFVKVLDGYFLKMHNELRLLMSPEKGMVETVLDVTASLFDFMQMHQGEIRLLLEIAANRADLLEKYKDVTRTIMSGAFARHNDRLKEAVKDGIIAPVTMEELLGEIILTDYSAFALMPMVSFIYGDDAEKIDAFLRRQREKAVQRMRDFLRPRQ